MRLDEKLAKLAQTLAVSAIFHRFYEIADFYRYRIDSGSLVDGFMN